MTLDEVNDFFEYKDGFLYWKKSKGTVKAGSKAGNQRKDGYIDIGYKGKLIRAHRIIWFMHYGFMPDFIDHINGLRNDNRIENLRVATRQQNQMNLKTRFDNSSGYTGVYWVKRLNKWFARIQLGYKTKHLGVFESIDDAIAVRKNAEIKYFGEFARLNK
jgi:hypothetical protein